MTSVRSKVFKIMEENPNIKQNRICDILPDANEGSIAVYCSQFRREYEKLHKKKIQKIYPKGKSPDELPPIEEEDIYELLIKGVKKGLRGDPDAPQTGFINGAIRLLDKRNELKSEQIDGDIDLDKLKEVLTFK